MSIIVVVKKAGKAVIAADTLSTFGETKVSAPYTTFSDKILRCDDSYLGVYGAAASSNVVSSLIENYRDKLDFSSKLNIFETAVSFHKILKEDYFINPKEDEHDSYESSQIEALIANPHGIFGLFSWREVYEFDRFWAAGSGMEYALGAMHAVYDVTDEPERIAEIGVTAACEFDNGCGLPLTRYSVILDDSPTPTKVKRKRKGSKKN